MNNRDVAIDIYNRLNRWSHGALTDFAVGIIEDELDMAFPEDAKNSVQMKDYEKIGNCNNTHCKYFDESMELNCSYSED